MTARGLVANPEFALRDLLVTCLVDVPMVPAPLEESVASVGLLPSVFTLSIKCLNESFVTSKDTIVKCGSIATLNNTYWESPTAISAPSTCTLSVSLDTKLREQRKPVCQIRWVRFIWKNRCVSEFRKAFSVFICLKFGFPIVHDRPANSWNLYRHFPSWRSIYYSSYHLRWQRRTTQ